MVRARWGQEPAAPCGGLDLEPADPTLEAVRWIGRGEALARLGVKTQTLYAYVSRGRIAARPDPSDPDARKATQVFELACPCHGSRYDLAGRVYKSQPAPLNLPVPPHTYETDDLIVIGLDKENA